MRIGSGFGLDPDLIGSVDPDPDPDHDRTKWFSKKDENSCFMKFLKAWKLILEPGPFLGVLRR
jgi:hypothetical protein